MEVSVSTDAEQSHACMCMHSQFLEVTLNTGKSLTPVAVHLKALIYSAFVNFTFSLFCSFKH